MPSQASVLLRRWREGEGLSINAAAKRFMTDRDTYGRWEGGASLPTLPNARRVEDVTGIAMRDWTEPPTVSAESPA